MAEPERLPGDLATNETRGVAAGTPFTRRLLIGASLALLAIPVGADEVIE